MAIVGHELNGSLKVIKVNNKLLNLGPAAGEFTVDFRQMAYSVDHGSVSVTVYDTYNVELAYGYADDGGTQYPYHEDMSQIVRRIFDNAGALELHADITGDYDINESITVSMNGKTSTDILYPGSNTDGWRNGRLTAAQYLEDSGEELHSIVIYNLIAQSQCVSADTLVRVYTSDPTSEIYSRIDRLTEGDMVLAMNPNEMQQEYVPVTKIFKGHVTAPIETYVFSNGAELKVVNNHRIYHKETNSMQYIQNFEIGDHTVNENNEFISLVSKSISEPIEQDIYFLANKYHNFYSDTIMSGDQATKTMHFEN